MKKMRRFRQLYGWNETKEEREERLKQEHKKVQKTIKNLEKKHLKRKKK